MASTKLSRTAGTPTSNKKFTISYWVKRSNIGSAGNGHIFDTYVDSTNRSQIHFDDDNVIDFRLQVSGSNTGRLKTNRVFRNTSAWYHIVASVDTTLGTADDRVKLYINGVQETSFSSRTNPSQNSDFPMAGTHTLGAYGGGTNYFDGTLTHVHFTDGYTYPATTFGETDSTSGVWKPKVSPSVTYGTNGFFLKFENSAAMGTDSSGNSNNFTVSGTLTQNVDTPDNNFATGNPLDSVRIYSGSAVLPTYSNGNNTINHSDANVYTGSKSTIAVSSGKWYCEAKCSAPGSQIFIGLTPEEDEGEVSETYLYEDDGTFGGSAYGSAYGGTHGGSAGDIIQIAFDATNGTVWFGINGTWQNSATQTEIENGTTANAAASGLTMTKFWHIASKGYNGATWNFNVGSGFFGTTAVASANADGNGFGAFEYAVPSGYYALCTKNLKEFG